MFSAAKCEFVVIAFAVKYKLAIGDLHLLQHSQLLPPGDVEENRRKQDKQCDQQGVEYAFRAILALPQLSP